MVLFLLKSSACLAVFLLFYKLLLEKERMHHFKRVYLLATLVLAMVIPSITFTEYIEVAPAPIEEAPLIYGHEAEAPATETTVADIETPPINYWPIILWSIYGLGVLIFSLKFLFNLWGIFRNVKNNPKLKLNSVINVLLNDASTPHTFFNYVFFNRKKFERNEIPDAVFIHEATHAKQKHSLDILLAELLQIVFWFNPLLFFIKKEIKLNHEFLADEAVLNRGMDTPYYQNILLAFAASSSHKNNQPSMANAINYSSYSSIKKRFTVMKTQTSRKSVLLRCSLILPLIALLVMGFSESRTVEIVKEDPNANELRYTTEIIRIFIDSAEQVFINNDRVALGNLGAFLRKLNTELSKKERESKVRVKIFPYDNTPESVISDIEQILVEYGVAQIDVVGPRVVSFPAMQHGVTEKELSEYNSLAKKYNARPKEKRSIPAKDLKSLESIYHKMSERQKANAQPFPECPDPKPSQQDGATDKQVAEYNALAKKYNVMLAKRGNIRIKGSEMERLEYLYDLMTDKQRKDAEPFPDFPKPPEPPTPPSPPEKSDKEIADEVIEEVIANQDPYDNLNVRVTPNRSPSINHKISHNIYVAVDRNAEEERIEHMEVREQIEEDMEVKGIRSGPPAPPAPPQPKPPLDMVIEMAKEGAEFYYKRKEITSDEAVEILKENEDLSISVTRKNDKRPVVKIDTHF